MTGGVVRGRRLALALVFLAAVGAVLVGPAAWPSAGDDAPAPGAPPPALAADEAAFYAALAPRLRAAAAQAHELVALGESRSRNLLAIRAGQRRMNDRLAEVEALAAARAAPERFAPALAAYRGAARAVRTAMDEAQAGFLRLDWDRVARATALMDRGAGELDRASSLLAAAATPVASTPFPTPGRSKLAPGVL